MRHMRRVLGGIFVLTCTTLLAQQNALVRSSASGVYTTAQAAAGEKIYFEKCANCHGAELGGIERAPALAGSAFMDTWQGRDLRRLRDRFDTMPPTAPGTLSDADAAAIVAFILRTAGLPAGTATLPVDRGELARITFDGPRGGATPARAAAPDPDAPPPFARRPSTPTSGPSYEWTTYGSNLASHRYSPADQITRDNFNSLQIAWRLKTDFLGPTPDTLYSATPLVVGQVLYTTAGMRRAAIALNAATGEMLWMHAEDEGRRGTSAIRNGAGRGLSYWASADGNDRRIIYVTPGYRLLALDAKTGHPIPSFGRNGAVDLKLDNDQEIDLDTGEIGLNATPLIVGDVVVGGAAPPPGPTPPPN
jgi:quinoprotein glucose dehydrogenase